MPLWAHACCLVAPACWAGVRSNPPGSLGKQLGSGTSLYSMHTALLPVTVPYSEVPRSLRTGHVPVRNVLHTQHKRKASCHGELQKAQIRLNKTESSDALQTETCRRPFLQHQKATVKESANPGGEGGWGSNLRSFLLGQVAADTEDALLQ